MLKALMCVAAILPILPVAAQPADHRGLAKGDVVLRVRGILVQPSDRSSAVLPAFPAERTKVNSSVMPEVDVTYMVSDNIGFELIAATTKHAASGRTGTTGSLGKLASTWVLPPTLTAQYHFNSEGSARPYVGAGVNYTKFWNESASDALEGAVGRTRVRMSDSVGWAAQAGVDIDLTPRMFLNFDIKYVDMDTTARLDTAAIGTQHVRLHLDPLVFGIGVGFRL